MLAAWSSDRVAGCISEFIAKFHYTGPTGPDPTRKKSAEPRSPRKSAGSPTKSADFVWSGPVGRGGATVLKVGGDHRSQKIFFDPPLFGQWGDKILLR